MPRKCVKIIVPYMKTGKKQAPVQIKWAIVRKARSYIPGASNCNLCSEEKLCMYSETKEAHYLETKI